MSTLRLVRRERRLGPSFSGDDGIIGRDAALMRVPPDALAKVIHPQVDADNSNEILAKGIGLARVPFRVQSFSRPPLPNNAKPKANRASW